MSLPDEGSTVLLPTPISLSATLKCLMLYTKKQQSPSYHWNDIRKELTPLYHPNMTLKDVIFVVQQAYLELIKDSRFQVGSFENNLFELLTEPISPKFHMKPITFETSYTIEQWYGMMLEKMLITIRLSNVGWIKHLLEE